MHADVLSVRISKGQSEYLADRSEFYGITVSVYVRRLIDEARNKEKKKYMDKETLIALRQLTNEINHIGININQIVHNVNSGFYSDMDKQQLNRHMDKIEILLNKAASSLGKGG